MPDNNQNYISSITLPNDDTYSIRDDDAVHSQEFQQAISNVVLPHKLIFGNGGVYEYDGSAEVRVPVYTGGIM